MKSFYADKAVLEQLTAELRQAFVHSQIAEVYAYRSDGIVLECLTSDSFWKYLALTWTFPAAFRLTSPLPRRAPLAPANFRGVLRGRTLRDVWFREEGFLAILLEPRSLLVLGLTFPQGGLLFLQEEAGQWKVEAASGKIDHPGIELLASPQPFQRPSEAASACPLWIQYDTTSAVPRPLCICPVDSATAIPPDAETFRTPSEALERFSREFLRWRAFHEQKTELERVLRRRLKKMERLRENLEKDLRESQDAEKYHLYGSLLLAYVGDNRRGESCLAVPNPEGSGTLLIALDPAKNRVENAHAYFHLARKLRRKGEIATERLAQTDAEMERSRELLDRISSAGSLKELRELQSCVGEAEAAVSSTTLARAGAASRRAGPHLLRFRSADGFEILAGRSAEENEYLTFRVAREHDFWFHVAGGPGAHVVVRNPQRLGTCPPRTAQQAASLAAYLSKQRNSSVVLVHTTQKRYLKKAKGGKPGEVLLTTFQSLWAKPALPNSGTGEPDLPG
ncbi:MAG: NFACT RNA binding domain-containing protein [candidate division KSB1 bacterium]|nr:NFACT RNA binding domain-containing protein [candidate division KSB1 bacterium]